MFSDRWLPAGAGILDHILAMSGLNPARSSGPAVFVDGWALAQLRLFRVAPIVGAAAAGAVYRWFVDQRPIH
jgi:glycerol uptake facilitator-like aquaporin